MVSGFAECAEQGVDGEQAVVEVAAVEAGEFAPAAAGPGWTVPGLVDTGLDAAW
jgi:hypothetical protein